MKLSVFVVCLSVGSSVWAQDGPPEYGTPIALGDAKKVMAGAEAEARRKNWPVAIAIVDNAGLLVMFQRLENTQLGSVQVAIEKAKTAALFRRETKAFEERIAEGGVNLKLLRLPGGLPMEGGLPIIVGGKVIGGIGVSGVASSQDAMVGRAGLAALPQQTSARDESNKTTISGTVTMDGKPLAEATIVFVPEENRPAGAMTDEHGRYELNLRRADWIADVNRVRITTLRDPFHESDGTLIPARPETVPARYNSRTQLTVDVVPGMKHIFNFDLASDE